MLQAVDADDSRYPSDSARLTVPRSLLPSLTRMSALSLLLLSAVTGSSGASLGRAAAGALPASVTLTAVSRDIPGSFLGLSVEVNELPSYAGAGAVFDRTISLLRTPAGAPILLRVGGSAADDAYWKVPVVNQPRWVFELGDSWLAQLAQLVGRDGLKVTLALNLAAHAPEMEASYANAVFHALPPGALVGLAIGNEPDLFPRQTALDEERVPGTLTSVRPDWAVSYSPASYRRDWQAYAQALATTVPDVALAGPETTRLVPAWMAAVDRLGRFTPRSLTVHRYPSSQCWSKASPFYPRISLLLSERASAGLAAALNIPAAFAHRRGMSLRVTELNSVSCGGRAGVSDSFATALWAPDVLFELLREGVDGVNWHIRLHLRNAPFELQGGRIEPEPELYGLTLFARMIGPSARWIGARVSSTGGLHLKVWAVRSARHTGVLVINKGPRAATVSLCCGPPRSYVRLERLIAPSITARRGVTLAGQTIGPDGRWHGREVTSSTRSTGERYRIMVGAYSAVLIQGQQISPR